MPPHRFNWPLWSGFLLSLAAFFSYFLLFSQYPITRDVPWVSYILFAIAIVLLIAGVRRAYATPSLARKIISTVTALLGTAIAVMFVFSVLVGSKLKPAPNAPAIGTKAPGFTLPDQNGRPVSLTQLIAASPNGVVLIFYRGYW